jgi:predicted transcriptional regulator of viral defense system
MQLSKLENLGYEKLKKNNMHIFRIKDLSLLMEISRTKAYNLVKAMKKKGIIKKAGKRAFALRGTNEFVVATSINYPSYISFWSALSYYGFSDQMPKKIFLATTKYTKDINEFKYVTLFKTRYFGYTKIGDIVIADKEKAIIDSLLFPKYAGGMKEIEKCLRAAINEINIERLIEYSLKMKSKAVLRRLGFVLEHLNYKGKIINKIIKKIGKGYELLDPSLRKKNNLNKRWLLDVNW